LSVFKRCSTTSWKPIVLIERGSYLSLTDAQVRILSRACGEGKKLFDYQVEITLDINFIDKLNSCIAQDNYTRMGEDLPIFVTTNSRQT
jgi:hypothetical protein